MGARSYTFGRRRNDWNQREKVDENSGKKITWFKSRGSGPEASVIGRGSGDGTHVIYGNLSTTSHTPSNINISTIKHSVENFFDPMERTPIGNTKIKKI